MGACGGSYCVGGALCLYLGVFTRWPDTWLLAETLIKANAELNDKRALSFANDIIQLNDSGDFDHAWKRLEEALTFSDGGE